MPQLPGIIELFGQTGGFGAGRVKIVVDVADRGAYNVLRKVLMRNGAAETPNPARPGPDGGSLTFWSGKWGEDSRRNNG